MKQCELRRVVLYNGVLLKKGEGFKDFTFIGEEYRIQADGHDFYIDSLFYNRAVSCMVPFDLKIRKSKSEHIG